jgi:hypothetical protein
MLWRARQGRWGLNNYETICKAGFARNPKEVRIQKTAGRISFKFQILSIGADFKMQENVATAMSSVGVQTLVCLGIQDVRHAKVYLHALGM